MTRERSDGVSPPCGYCGNFHKTVCPFVKAFEYYDNGMLKRVEFHPPTPPQYIDVGRISVGTHGVALSVS